MDYNTSESKPQCSINVLMLIVKKKKNGLIIYNIALNIILDTCNKVLISPNNSMIVGNFLQNTNNNSFLQLQNNSRLQEKKKLLVNYLDDHSNSYFLG